MWWLAVVAASVIGGVLGLLTWLNAFGLGKKWNTLKATLSSGAGALVGYGSHIYTGWANLIYAALSLNWAAIIFWVGFFTLLVVLITNTILTGKPVR